MEIYRYHKSRLKGTFREEKQLFYRDLTCPIWALQKPISFSGKFARKPRSRVLDPVFLAQVQSLRMLKRRQQLAFIETLGKVLQINKECTFLKKLCYCVGGTIP